MWLVIKSVISLLVSLMMTVFPNSEILKSLDILELAVQKENCLLNASLISDVHIDHDWPIGEWILRNGLNDLKRSVDDIDALIVSGDLTNYGDAESMESFFEILANSKAVENWVVAMGNHDVGHVEDTTQQGARERFVELYNKYTPSFKIENAYYKADINGYRFVTLVDDGDDTWDHPEISDAQLEFLDAALAEAADRGLPMFVISHVPVEGVNGQDKIWEGGGMGEYSDAVQTILEKYTNVFFISGHVHTGINGPLTKAVFGFSCVETINGVNYVNLPTYMIINRFGIPWGGMGFQMEVYEDEVLFRARNFGSSKWYPAYDHSVTLVK